MPEVMAVPTLLAVIRVAISYKFRKVQSICSNQILFWGDTDYPHQPKENPFYAVETGDGCSASSI